MKRHIFNTIRAFLGLMMLASVVCMIFGFTPFGFAVGGLSLGVGTVIAGEVGTTENIEAAASGIHLDDIDNVVTKMWPSAAPLDQLLRTGMKDQRRKTDSLKVRHYSVETKPFDDLVTAQVTASNQETFNLGVGNVNLYGPSDTIFIQGVGGYAEGAGSTKLANAILQLYVISVDTGNNQLLCMPVNGDNTTSKKSLLKTGQQDIAEGATIVIGGRALNELTVQTDPSVYVPEDDYNYCQYFGSQIELSKWSEKHRKEVKFSEADQLELALFDYRVKREISYWFGSRNIIYPAGRETRTCGGLTYFIDNEIDWTSLKTSIPGGYKPNIAPENIDAMVQSVFSGNAGSGQRWMFIGGHLWNALKRTEDIQKTLSAKETQTQFGLYFNKINTGDGELVLIKHPLFELMGYGYNAVIVDCNNIGERHFEAQKVVDFDKQKLAQSNSDARFISEVSCPVVKYKQTHAIIKGPVFTSLI